MQDNDDEKLLIAKINDKIEISKTQNKITNSEFLNEYQIANVEKELKKTKEDRYFFNGGYEGAVRKVLVLYPEKLDKDIVLKNIKDIIVAIKVEVPSEIRGKLQHKDYLGMLMSFGLRRERIGDIIVNENSAYIVILKENSEYIKNEIKQEKRLKKAKVEIVEVSEIEARSVEFEDMRITVKSIRLDNIISEILRTSRRIAQEYIEMEKVFINYTIETKNTKTVKENDVLVIRGKGKYIIEELLGPNKNGKEVIQIKKYI